MAKVRDDIKQQILDRNDIVEVIGEHLHLHPAGGRFKALCPFHQEKTPSFIVHPDRQLFHCFGCQTGGDVIKFIQLHENLDFVGALEYLARRVGVRLEWTGEEKSRDFDDHRCLHEAMEYFQQCLFKAENPRLSALLKKRGLTRDLINLFQIGYADPQWDSLISYFKRKKVPLEILAQSGLITSGNASQHRDWFRDRLIFPILTASGQVVGFGGRALGDEMPKYLNSPETGKFHKGKLLYALNLAKKAMKEKKFAILAEGYMDVVALHRHGFTQSVGSLGTALTEDQVRLLKRYVQQCYLVYDGDEAGRKAALRAVDVFRDVDLPCRVVLLPDGTDPDDFLSQEGAARLDALLQQGMEAFDYRLETACREHDVETLEGRRAVARLIGQWIMAVPSEIARSEYWGSLAERIKTPIEALRSDVERIRTKSRSTKLETAPEGISMAALNRPSPVQLAKQGLVALMLEDAQYLKPVKEFWSSLQRDRTANDPYDSLIERVIEVMEKQGLEEAKDIRQLLDGEGHGPLLTQILLGDPVPQNRDKALKDYARQIQQHLIQQRIDSELQNLAQLEKEKAENPDDLSGRTRPVYQLEQQRYGLR